MKTLFANTFFDSLQNVFNKERWYNRLWDTIWYDIPRFFSNIWSFRKELYNFYSWESMYSLAMLRRGTELGADYLEKYGMEVEESRMKKIRMMRRAVEIMKLNEGDGFLELAEADLDYEYRIGAFEFKKVDNGELGDPAIDDGEDLYEMFSGLDEKTEEINSLISKRSDELETAAWKELFEILHGQDHEEFKLLQKKHKDEDPEKAWNLWDVWYNGAGMKNWWD